MKLMGGGYEIDAGGAMKWRGGAMKLIGGGYEIDEAMKLMREGL